MTAGSPDLVDCLQLAGESAVLERRYELRELHRLKDLKADPRGTVLARFEFARLPGGPGATVTVHATPVLVCQRCMQDFASSVDGGSHIRFAEDDAAGTADSERESVRMNHGLVSLRELAEEELLLALPIAPACSTPKTCGKAPGYVTGDDAPDRGEDLRRPFSALKDLLKKT